MNERIKELMSEAVEFRLDPDSKHYEAQVSPEELEVFAELIVKECVRMCEVTQMSFVTHGCDVEASGAITVKQFIEEHFGVES